MCVASCYNLYHQLALKLVDTTTRNPRNTAPSAMHVVCALLSSPSVVEIKDLTTMQVLHMDAY